MATIASAGTAMLTAWLYVNFILFFVQARDMKFKSVDRVRIFLQVTVPFAVAIISVVKALKVEAGIIPPGFGKEAEPVPTEGPVPRFCKICKVFKPDRSHHCGECDRCVLELDHHCFWLDCCIGFYNRKFFLLFLFWISVALDSFIYIIFTTPVVVHHLMAVFGEQNFTWSASHQHVNVLLVSLIVVAVGMAVTGFTLFHFGMVVSNYTTIEFCEKRGTIRKGKRYQHLYNVSMAYNWTQTFGRNPLLWLLPISARSHVSRHEAVYYIKTEQKQS
eukprot:GILK01008192.1.p1 GENE.GILK01008192.1~~GILK01008192.1.p1  ORF type:complete len:286 (-),score=28.00 GILK01008192.1:321-1145(-)